ncbi:unnamed protein product [Miscanthus lutarioriparius]|uniref:F-box domain-containing protein n=1 Tax=Miscanthus lutarioriparius TaxID=422564 RepID=A0A811R0Z2_9POAL|nr:unnamed protein product [Miscanthus lutarioriparius]
MEKKAGDAEIVEEDRGRAASSASTSSRKKRSAVDGASGACLCDDVIGNILAYLPARTAIGCMALSKRHRDLIRSPEFRSLHCSLGAPLPRPHIAYIATASLRYKQYRGRVSEFHGFHVAGAGDGISSSNAPMRAIFGDSYLGYRCVNTCNGVVLLATNDYSPLGRCVLWNPAVADVVREFTVPADTSMEGGNVNYLVLGLGYGRRSETYKLLLFHMDYTHWKHSLQVYALVGGQPRLRPAVSSPPGIDGAIQSQESLYMDGTVYLLDVDRSVILAFDVDDETVTTIGLPGKRDRGHPRHVRSRLMEMQGRLCLATNRAPPQSRPVASHG